MAVSAETGHRKQNEIEKVNRMQTRLHSYINKDWKSKKSYVQLSMAGFRYTGSGDRVECDYCKKRVVKWTEDDDPLETHYRLSPDCPYMKELGYRADMQIPKYKKYANYQLRITSMEKVPHDYLDNLPHFQSLVTSGFFYQGTFDRMSCFHCGLVLRDWEADTIPNQVHKQYGKNCKFIETVMESEQSQGNFMQIHKKSTGTTNNNSNKHELHNRNYNVTTTVSNPAQEKLVREMLESANCTRRPPPQNCKFRPIGRFSNLTQFPRQLVEADGCCDFVDGGSVGSNTSDTTNSTTPKVTDHCHNVERPTQLSYTQTERTEQSEIVTTAAPSTPLITPVEEAVLEMGYSLHDVNRAIKERHGRGEGNFPDATSLCLAVMDLPEDVSRTES